MVTEIDASTVLIDLNGIILPDMYTSLVTGMDEYHTASSILSQVRALSAKYQQINIVIGVLYGGALYEAKAALAAMYSLKQEGRLSAHVSSLGASAGAIIAVGLNASIDPYAELMFHAASAGIYGNADEMQAIVDSLRQTDAIMVQMIVDKSNLSEKEAKKLMVGDNFLTATKAKENGMVSEITDRPFGRLQTANYDSQNAKAMINIFKTMSITDLVDGLKNPKKGNKMTDEELNSKISGAVASAVASAVEPFKASLAEKETELNALKAGIPTQVQAAVDAAVAVKESDFAVKLAEKDAVILALSKVPGASENTTKKGDQKTEGATVSAATIHTRAYGAKLLGRKLK